MSSSQEPYSVNGYVLTLTQTGAVVSFPWLILEVLAFDEIFVVLLEPDPGSRFNENVFGVAADGRVIWTIEQRKHVYDDSPYTSVLKEGDQVKLFNWDGDELIVDPKSGVVVAEGYGK